MKLYTMKHIVGVRNIFTNWGE